MAVRRLPAGLERDLSVLGELVAEILAHPLVRVKPLRAPNHLAVILNKLGGLPVKDKSVLEPVEDRVEPIALTDLVRILRQFDVQKDPTNFENLVNRLLREPIEGTMRSGAQECLEEFSLKHLPKHLHWSAVLKGFNLTPKSAYDLYLYGSRFHHKPKERELWKTIRNSRFEPVLYSAVLHAAVAKANAVIEFYRLLRVHGHVKPVPGDPTFVPEATQPGDGSPARYA